MGANSNPQVVGLDELLGKSNYFIGNDPSNWHTNIPTYTKVQYQDIYPGIDLIYYGNQRQLEYDFVVAPGADPGAIKLAFAGLVGATHASPFRIDDNGDLILHTEEGEVRLLQPRIYQEINGTKQAIPGGYVLLETPDSGPQTLDPRLQTRHVGFHVAAYDTSKPLIIDPVLSYSTYLGGSGDDFGNGIAVDSSGNAYVTGETASTNFPTANPLQAVFGGGICGTAPNTFPCPDAFMTKLNAAGSALVYSTYFGGSDDDEGFGIAVDASGNAYVTGTASSVNFPTVNPIQATFGGKNPQVNYIGGDAFVTKLNPSGSALVYSTFLGGVGEDVGNAIAVDDSGHAYVMGYTASNNFPTTSGAFRRVFGGGLTDVFVAKLSSPGSSLEYSTYLGGSLDDFDGRFNSLAVDAAGNAYAAGVTNSTNFPTASAFQSTKGADYDGWICKLNASGSALVYSTYLGGNGFDTVHSIAVDADGNLYATGHTTSANFPTANALRATPLGGDDIFTGLTPNFQFMRFYQGGFTKYRALQVHLRGRFDRTSGLLQGAAYTLSYSRGLSESTGGYRRRRPP